MKNAIKLMGIMALAMILGFSLISCDDLDDTPGGDTVFTDPPLGYIAINGTLKFPTIAGSTITHYEISVFTSGWETSRHTRAARGTGDVTSWQVNFPFSTNTRSVYYQVRGFSNNQYFNPVFVMEVQDITTTVSNSNYSGVNIDLSDTTFKSLTGSLDVIPPPVTPNSVPFVVVEVGAVVQDGSNHRTLGQFVYAPFSITGTNPDWRINVPVQNEEVELSFHIWGFQTAELWSGGDDNILFERLSLTNSAWSKFSDADLTGINVVFDFWYSFDNAPTTTMNHFYNIDNNTVTAIVGGTPGQKWHATICLPYNGTIGQRYQYEFTAWTESGTREINVQYYSNNATGVYLGQFFTLNTTPTTFTFTGRALQEIPEDGHALQFQGGDVLGTFYVKDVVITEAPITTWFSYASAPTTINRSFDSDTDTITAIVGGTAGYRWHAAVGRAYDGTIGQRYQYEFTAWTQSGTREIYVQYYYNDVTGIHRGQLFPLTTDQTRFSFIGDALLELPQDDYGIHFQGGDVLGTFYIKDVVIIQR